MTKINFPEVHFAPVGHLHVAHNALNLNDFVYVWVWEAKVESPGSKWKWHSLL